MSTTASGAPVLGAMMLAAASALGGDAAYAQRVQATLPQEMRVPPMRGDSTPTRPDDGRVGDPLSDAVVLLPPAEVPTLANSEPDAMPEEPSDLDHDGAVGTLIEDVANVPSPRPSQTEIDGKVGDLIGDVPSIPTARPDERPQAASYAPAMTRDAPLPPAPAQMSAAEKQCRAKLGSLGVAFREMPRLTDDSGCLVDWPIEVTSLGDDIDIQPAAVLNCEATAALAEYAQQTVSPRAQLDFGSRLATINHASAYVCRGRVGTGETKISEHAFGNAVDIGSFVLDGGRTLDVRAYGPAETRERDFMRSVRGAACGRWKTVLGPGTNADHATHFHLDLAHRRRGSTYCK